MPILVTRSSMPSFEEYCEEIRTLWDSRHLTNRGEKHVLFENALLERTNGSAVSLFANGHLALEAALSAFEFPAGSEVITTPFTFASTTHAIVRAGLVPVFCDVDPSDYTLDHTKIESLITEKTVAVLPVHVYGNFCRTEEIERLAKKHSLRVIYDAAHAFGETKDGRDVATFGDVTMFSFHATKVFQSVEGGALFTSDESLRASFETIKNFGLSAEDAVLCGTNAKMSEFHAAMGLLNLKHLDGEIARRAEVVNVYRTRLSDKEGIVLCKEQEGVKENFAYFPVRFTDQARTREDVLSRLKENDIFARRYFYPLTCDFSCYRHLPQANVPVARAVAEEILTLPLYADLSLADAERICDIILS